MKEQANSLKKEGNENFKSGGNSILGAVRYPSPTFSVPCSMYAKASLNSQAIPPPVFDRLQYANMEGKGLVDLVTCG